MAYHNANPLRAVPAFRAPGMAFGPSPMDRLVGNLRAALDQRDGYCPAYAQACAKLAWANRTKSEHRRANQATAFRAINAARAAARACAKAVVADGDPGYDGSNTTGFVSPAADALEGPIDLA